MATWMAPSYTPSFGSGFFGSKARSSGLVQITGSAASTTMSVFDGAVGDLGERPALFLAGSRSNTVPGPAKTR